MAEAVYRIVGENAELRSAPAGGFTSSMEREVQNFQGLIAAYRSVLGI